MGPRRAAPLLVCHSSRHQVSSDSGNPCPYRRTTRARRTRTRPRRPAALGQPPPQLLHPRPSGDASRRSLAAAPNPGVNAPVPDMAALQQHQQAGLPNLV